MNKRPGGVARSLRGRDGWNIVFSLEIKNLDETDDQGIVVIIIIKLKSFKGRSMLSYYLYIYIYIVRGCWKDVGFG